jgi:predicted DNA-binding protein (MmcQ/YjbR family)
MQRIIPPLLVSYCVPLKENVSRNTFQEKHPGNIQFRMPRTLYWPPNVAPGRNKTVAMDNERIRELCLRLPYTVEAIGWGHHLVFWVGDKAIGGKMYALIHLDDAGTGVAWFHAGAEHYSELLEIEGIIPAPYMARAHWVAVERWNVLRARQWEEELHAAHSLIFEKLPRKTKALLTLPEKERTGQIHESKRDLAEQKKSRKPSRKARASGK